MNDSANTSVRSAYRRRRGRWLLVYAVVAAVLAPGSVMAAAPDDVKTPPAVAAANESKSELTTPPGENPAAPPPSGVQIQYVGPDTYFLLDAQGRPQPMPGMTYEDFLAAWKNMHQPKEAETRPGFTIDRLNFAGKVIDQRAELKFDATIRLLADEPVDVPLGLVGALLDGEPKFGRVPSGAEKSPGDGRAAAKHSTDDHLSYDPDHGGFVAHLVGRAGEEHTVSFGLIVPVAHDGAELTLPINCPHALSSQLILKIDSAVAEVRATGGVVTSEDTTADGTTVKVAGPAGLFRLTWQTVSKDSPTMRSILNALGAIRITIDGRGVRSDARLTVRSYGGAFDQFRIRLPAGATLLQARPDTSARQDAKYRVRVEPESTAPGGKDSGRQVVVVEFPEKQQGPVVVNLSTEQSSGGVDRGQEVNLAGFEVLGAVRQFGDVALDVADDWQARWNIGSFVRQVDPAELDPSLQTSNLTAAFQYDRQPWSLKARVTPRQLSVRVTPKYELECLADEARLNVRLSYQVFGAPAFAFNVQLNGWKITDDPVESGGLVETDQIDVTAEDNLVLPLAQGTSRRAEVSFTLRRPLPRDSSRLELPLPVPVADSVGTGELTVHATPDIDLLPDLANSTGLMAAPASPASDAKSLDNGPELHFRSLLPAAVFVTDRSSCAGRFRRKRTRKLISLPNPRKSKNGLTTSFTTNRSASWRWNCLASWRSILTVSR